jgi:hypothetical protein
MKRRGFLFAMISALSLMWFACGRSGPNSQAPETQTNETNAAGTMGAQPAAGPTNEFVSVPFDLNVRDWSGQVGEFAKTRERANRVTTMRLPSGATFVGEVDDQEMDGWGILSEPNGTQEEGEWRHGQPYRVTGVDVEPDGTREEGTWNHAGMTSGGTITWKDGRVYKGEWKVVKGAADLPDGTGTMTWPDGRTYTGQFLDGTMDGAGKMTYPDGRIEEGTWMQGKFMGGK